MRLLHALMILALLRALLSVVRGADAPAEGMDHWKAAVRAKFPEVPQMTTTDLAARLADTNRPPPVLLDVRTRKEFDRSHLPSARHVDPDAKSADVDGILAGLTNDVVVYCSVGWRSSALAQRLHSAGRTNVMNLEGSIFAWANEDRPLEANGRPAERVHPYNRTFGNLLKPERRAAP
jgi:rhodanese-related sulfurtransferase